MDTAYRVSPLRANDPERLGEYQLVGRLGTGGMGVVYLAESEDGTYVAIKLIHPALAADPEFSGRFRSEVERARQVPSFCTAEFLGADLDHDPPYLVVEYVDGPSLEDVVEERGPLRGGALHSLAVGVATALTGIHGAGVIHRDLKPDNVLLPPGSPKVIDFGIARSFEATSEHTRTDVMVGTVAYMAPERFSDEPDAPLTAAADVFAWGCVITYAGTGRTPFRGDSPSATAARILTQPPRLDGLPDSLCAIVHLALSKDPADRPTAPDLLAMLLGEKTVPSRSAAGPAAALVPVAGPEAAAPEARALLPVAAEPASRSAGGRRRLLVTLVVLGLLVGLTVVGLLVRVGGEAPLAAPAAPATSTAATVAPAPAGTSEGPVRTAPLSESSRSAPPSAPTRNRPSSATGDDAPANEPSAADRPAANQPAANPSGRNLALGRPVVASSSEGVQWAAAQAVDGNLGTRWGSGFSDPQWLRVDLGAPRRISEIVLRWERAYAVSYQVEVSTDAAHWTVVYRTTAGVGGDVTVKTGGVTGRYVRMYGMRRSGQYGCSLYELEVR